MTSEISCVTPRISADEKMEFSWTFSWSPSAGFSVIVTLWNTGDYAELVCVEHFGRECGLGRRAESLLLGQDSTLRVSNLQAE